MEKLFVFEPFIHLPFCYFPEKCYRLNLPHANKTWKEISGLPGVSSSLNFHQMSTFGEKVFVLGGTIDLASASQASKDIHMLDPEANGNNGAWSLVNAYPHPIHR